MSGKRKASAGAADDEPMTLEQAHDVLRRRRPNAATSPAQRRAFYEQAAQLYASVADVDKDHHFEALAFAGMAREDAEKFSDAACYTADGRA